MRVLFVVPNVPSFIRPRPLNLIRGLARKHEVSVVCLATNETDEQFVSQLRPYCHQLQVVRLSRWRSLWNCGLAVVSHRSIRCAYFDSPPLRALVKAKVDAAQVDLLHAEHLKTLPMVRPVLGRVPSLFDAVDCLSMLESRRRQVTRNPLLKLFSWIERKKFALAEADATTQFSRVAISSEVDRSAFPVSPGLREKIHVISNGVDLEHFGFRHFQAQKNLLVFCAKLDYFPNEDAALYLIEKIWPLLKLRRPELELEIVGSRPSRRLRRHGGKNNIRVIASVPDVRPHIGRASIALCPIRIRAGIQNKVLEAMAMGVPVIATSLCCEGLPVVPGKHLLTADDPSRFASAVELLLDNAPLKGSIIGAARAYVERHHDWADSVAALSNLYEEAIAGCTTIAA